MSYEGSFIVIGGVVDGIMSVDIGIEEIVSMEIGMFL